MKKIIVFISLGFITHTVLAQTNTFPSSGNTGIGTLSPAGKLEVSGTVLIGGSNIDSRFTAGNLNYLKNSGKMVIGWNRSEAGGETDFISNQGGGTTGGFAFYNFSNTGVQNQIMFLHGNGNVGIGMAAPTEKLSVNGKIRAKEVKVENANWPDYVFSKSYSVPKLDDIATFIFSNGHLPGIPSAQEVKVNGIDLGDMNARLLKKIEELTLILLEQDKIIREQSSKNQEQDLLLKEIKLKLP